MLYTPSIEHVVRCLFFLNLSPFSSYIMLTWGKIPGWEWGHQLEGGKLPLVAQHSLAKGSSSSRTTQHTQTFSLATVMFQAKGPSFNGATWHTKTFLLLTRTARRMPLCWKIDFGCWAPQGKTWPPLGNSMLVVVLGAKVSTLKYSRGQMDCIVSDNGNVERMESKSVY